MKEKKTGKRSRITITPKVRGTLELFRTTYPNVVQNPENFLFFAKKTFPLGSTNIGRVRMWKIVNRLTGSIGLQGSF